MGRLTVRQVARLGQGRHGDEATLYLAVKESGARSWVQRIVASGRRRDIGLGDATLISLASARQKALKNRIAIAEGGDPFAGRGGGRGRPVRRVEAKVAAASAPTFAAAAASAFEANRGRWRSEKTARAWDQELGRYVLPVLGARPINEIERGDVLEVLAPIWSAKPALGRKLRTRLRTVFEWAVGAGHVERNIVDLVAGALPAQPVVREHHSALPYGEVAAALRAVESSGSSVPARACLTFTILTACRSGEGRLATWAEVDVEAREWRIPASRMKSNREHRVPLCDATLAILDTVRPLRVAGDLIFPSVARPGAALSVMALSRTLADAGLGGTVHGFRATFRTWVSECTTVPHAVAELALAHSIGSAVERSYARSDLFDQRAALMRDWAAYVTGGVV